MSTHAEPPPPSFTPYIRDNCVGRWRKVRDPKSFMKQQVLGALSSFQAVRRKNEDAAEDHAKLRRQMLQGQGDAQAVIDLLATNMGFWLLGQQACPYPSLTLF